MDDVRGIAEVLEWHRDIAWNHITEQAICGDCDEVLGSFDAPMLEQDKWMRAHQAEELAREGFGRLREAQAYAWQHGVISYAEAKRTGDPIRLSPYLPEAP